MAIPVANPILTSSINKKEEDLLPIGTNAPNFWFTDLKSNESFSLTSFQGKVIILDLFATWCSPCRQAIPKIGDIYRCYSDNDLIVISVDIDLGENETLLLDFIEAYDMQWLVARDNNSVVDINYGSGYIPTMYIIDQDQTIAYAEVGFNYNGIINALDQLSLIPISSLPSYDYYDYPAFFQTMLDFLFFGITLFFIFGVGIIIYVRYQRKKKMDFLQSKQQVVSPSSFQERASFSICPNCNRSITPQAKYCAFCGSDLR
jgi:thiol-disulfide isomerase/thioredoxin